MRLAYFVHDLSDPAVLRRVRMLSHAGVDVTVLGFHRSELAPSEIGGAPAVGLGRTFDGRLNQRVRAVAAQGLRASMLARRIAGCDVIMARTLEMLVLASAARWVSKRPIRLVYECLDIHRLMLAPGLLGRALRAIERALLRRCDLLLTSSPAFGHVYFGPIQGVGGALPVQILLVENKLLDLGQQPQPSATPQRPEGPPWKIGWFGMLRCRRSFAILCDLARSHPGEIEVVIGGRASGHEFEDFENLTAASPGVTFVGAYRPDDLERLYRGVHFAWAIDYFEEGANSQWLLPNRIYESGAYGVTPVALASVETGRWLSQRGLGLVVDDPAAELAAFVGGLAPHTYRDLERRAGAAPAAWFKAGSGDCVALAHALAGQS